MVTDEEFLQLRKKVFEKATPEQRKKLFIADAYGTPSEFWSLALKWKLITEEEYKKAYEWTGKKLWDYRGD